MNGYLLALYDPADELVARGLPFPSLPYRGLLLVAQGRVWEVVVAMAFCADAESIAAANGDPIMVDVRVIPADGIHDS